MRTFAATRRQFLVAPGHQASAGQVVIAIEPRYTVVAKRDHAASLAMQTDPRAERPVVQLIWSRDRHLSLINMDAVATPESVAAIRASSSLSRRPLIGSRSESGRPTASEL